MRIKFLQNLIDRIRNKNFLNRNVPISQLKSYKNAIFKVYGFVNIDKTAEIGNGCFFQNGVNECIKIGKYAQINPYVIFFGGNITIGNYVMIAPHTVITTANHNYKQTEKPMRLCNCIDDAEIIIEDDVWIGANCTLIPGAVIRKGAVIGAGSVVNSEIPEYSIAVGSPAKVIKQRNRKCPRGGGIRTTGCVKLVA